MPAWESRNASVLKGKLMGRVEKDWSQGGGLYLGNYLLFD